MLLLNDNIVFVGRLSNIMLQNVQVMIICHVKVLFFTIYIKFFSLLCKNMQIFIDKILQMNIICIFTHKWMILLTKKGLLKNYY